MKIGKKIRWTYWVIILIVFAVISISFHFFSQRYLFNEARKELRSDATAISDVLKSVPLKKDAVRLSFVNKQYKTAGKLVDSKILILDKQKQLIFTNLSKREAAAFQNSNKDRYVAETLPIYNKRTVVKGYATLVTPVESIQSLKTIMRKTLMIGFFIAALTGGLLGYFLEKNITYPIYKLKNHMRHFQVKEEYHPLYLNSKDEIANLSESFNQLALKFKQYDQQQKYFLQNASHELKTPLMGIQGNAEGIMDGVIEGDDVYQSLEIIVSESQRLKKIVEELSLLLMLENVNETYHFKPISIGSLVEEAILSLKPIAIKGGISLSLQQASDIQLMVDSDRLKQAITNILGNALRYAEEEIKIIWNTYENHIELIISDDGNGIEQGKDEQIFERFYKGANGGSGIGLAIAKAIIEAHSGKVTAKNNEEKGAVFTIVLPINRDNE